MALTGFGGTRRPRNGTGPAPLSTAPTGRQRLLLLAPSRQEPTAHDATPSARGMDDGQASPAPEAALSFRRRGGEARQPPCIVPALRSPVDPPHHLLWEATEPRFGGGVRLEIEVAIHCALQAP